MNEFDRVIEHLRHRLEQPLPGRQAFMTMAPQNPRHMPVEQARSRGCREGGVLVLLYPVEGRAHTVLTVRSASLRTHAGQISLPGGRRDPGEDVIQCAVREAWEELGIDPNALDILGVLSELYIPPSNFCLAPVLAVTHERPDFRPHDAEVAQLIEVPVRHFIGSANQRSEVRFIEGEDRRIPYYEIGEHKVWGATAMMLAEVAALWHELRDEPRGVTVR